jgi:hypothetical protein
MHYIIQENVFRESHYNILIQTIQRSGFSYDIVRIFPFVDKIVNINDIPAIGYNVDDLPNYQFPNEKCFVFGAVKLARICSKHNIYPGSQLNDNHDYEVYSKYYKDNLLNYNSSVYNINDNFEWKASEYFIRPTKDSKLFTGEIFTKDKWLNTLQYISHNKLFKDEQTNIQVTTVKKIYKEVRCWVVNKKIVTASQYRLNNKTILDNMVDDDGIQFAQQMVNIFQLNDCFVIDICLTEQGWKIVECGCINACGFYLADLSKLINKLEDYYG